MYPQATVDRFWSRVDKTGDHWLWLGYKSRGYGKFRLGSTGLVRTHRFAWEITNGPIPPGLLVLHRPECHTPACVRPSHLYLGDQVTNMEDRSEAGTGFRFIGEAHPKARLRATDIPVILTAWANGARKEDLAAQYGVSVATIGFVVTGRTWKHIPRPDDLPVRQRRNPHLNGEQNPNARLTAEDVIQIRQRAAAGMSHTHLAEQYDMTQPAISNIVARRTWRHVP